MMTIKKKLTSNVNLGWKDSISTVCEILKSIAFDVIEHLACLAFTVCFVSYSPISVLPHGKIMVISFHIPE